MGKALMTAARWLAPLGAWLGPRQRNAVTSPPNGGHGERAKPLFSDHAFSRTVGAASESLFGSTALAVPATACAPEAPETGGRASCEAERRPLRVLRIQEGRASPRHAGRLVISGRMADVCAELDRLAAAHPGLLH